MKVDTKIFDVIQTMRFPLVILVVFAHVIGEHRAVISFDRASWDTYVFVSELISHHLGKISVPLYFLISGFFFFRTLYGQKKYSNGAIIKKKVNSLLWPYIFWNLALILGTLALNSIAGLMNFSVSTSELSLDYFMNLENLKSFFWTGPINFPLWFIRDLMCMMLITPLLHAYIRYTKKYGMLLLLVLYVSTAIGKVTGFSNPAIFFFTLGGYFYENKVDILKFCCAYKRTVAVPMIVTLGISLALNGKQGNEIALRVFMILAMITTVNVMNYIQRFRALRDWLMSLSAASFFIYLVHQIFIINWMKGFVMRSSLSSSAIGMLLGYFIIPTATIIICLMLFFMLRKIMPNILSFLLGGRL